MRRKKSERRNLSLRYLTARTPQGLLACLKVFTSKHRVTAVRKRKQPILRLPIILIGGIICFAANGFRLLILPEQILPLLRLLLDRRDEQIPVVVDALRLRNAPLHHLRRELIVTTEVVEANNVVRRFLVLHEANGRNDADIQALRQEWRLLHVQLDEFALQMLLGQQAEVLVDDLTPEGALTVEVAHHILASLARVEEVALIRDLCVGAVTVGTPFLLLLTSMLHLRQPLFAQHLDVVLLQLIQAVNLRINVLLDHFGCFD